jgi:hypothetical protein
MYKAKNERDSTIQYLELSVALNNKLFNQEKEREIQNISFNEQIHQQEIQQGQEQFQTKLRTYVLLAAVLNRSF